MDVLLHGKRIRLMDKIMEIKKQKNLERQMEVWDLVRLEE
jgi:hypothetical protein